VPVEEQVIEEDEGGGMDQGLEAGDSYAEENNETKHGEENEEETREAEDRKQQLPETGASKEVDDGSQEEEVDLQPQKELGPTPPGIQFSDGLEEILDVGAAVRRSRGRPKKAGVVGKEELVPLDPHKGSVTDSVEEVCVDPGEMGAILEAGGVGGPGPPGGGKGGQLASYSRGG
jgi:hypothetical protein